MTNAELSKTVVAQKETINHLTNRVSQLVDELATLRTEVGTCLPGHNARNAIPDPCPHRRAILDSLAYFIVLSKKYTTFLRRDECEFIFTSFLFHLGAR